MMILQAEVASRSVELMLVDECRSPVFYILLWLCLFALLIDSVDWLCLLWCPP